MKTVLIAIAFLSALTLKAQEIQVSIDEEGKVEFIDAKLEKKLGLFPEYKGLKEVRLFQISDTIYVLEILYQPGNKLMKHRQPLSEEQVKDFRKKVTARIQQQVPEVVINQEGRTMLLISTTAVSLGYYGYAVPSVLEVGDPKASVGLYMLTSGAGFFISFAATKNRRITAADAIMSIYGQTRGIAHGISLAFLINENPSSQALFGLGMLTSIGEGLGGYAWADKTNMTAGTASTIGAMGDFGIGIGLGTAHITGLLNNVNNRKLSASILLGSAAGIASGVLLAKNQSYTKGDALVLRGAGFLGAYVPLAAMVIAEPSNEKAYTVAATFGSVAGIAMGHILTKENDFTTGQGILICLGEVAGGLIGLGTGYLITPDARELEKVLVTTSALGAIGGFALITSIYTKKAKAEDKSYSFNLNLNPYGLLGLATGNKQQYKSQVPIFSARLRF